ncbi:T9SS type A sorting domain-containing protein [Salibacter sp.]|uniref:T9SS type A sorting domain-containing protein n=1 Tax=Salibacter sp. TaxID=2010995 RepID=UPI00286FF809|nr:T9SS type A sorting domain-containing protein [Salibacter sp.]MDR9488079.1 T9SS type A sorting domain-containing protein [Salibacter sp.]
MKKYLLTVAGLALAGGLSAQTALQDVPEAPKALNVAERTSIQSYTFTRSGGNAPTALNGDTIFEETFGNGLAGDGSNGAWSSFILNNSSAPLAWEYRGPNTSPDNTEGSIGAYSGVTQNENDPIASATLANGFMIFDSDYLDNNGSPQTMGSGPVPTPHIGILETPTMDFTGYQSIYLRMTSYFRRFQSTAHVAFSTDGGMTYPDTIDIYTDDFTVNAATPNAELIYVPIPFNIPGNNNVKAQFVFDGATISNANGSGYYFWQIDDIQFVQGPDNDLVLDDNFFNWGLNQGQNYYYANIPLNHASTDTVNFSGELTNQGSQTQPNSRVDVFFNGSLETQTTSNPSLATGSSDSLGNSGDVIMNKAIGNYAIDFVANSDNTDDFPVNDTANFNLNITEDVYSRADDSITLDQGNFYQGYNYAVGFSMTIKEIDTLESVDIYFSSFSAENAQVQICVWDANFNNLTSTDPNSFYNLGAGDIGAWSNYDITDLELTPGDYIVGFQTFGDSVSMAQGQPGADPQTVFVRPDNNAAQDWFFTSLNPKIKANVKGFACDELTGDFNVDSEASCGLADGQATVTFGTNNYDVEWPDGTMTATNSGLAAGSYMVTISDANGCSGTVEVIMTNANAPLFGGYDVTDVTCNGDNDGSLTANATGGSTPYTYTWSNGGSGQTISGLAPGQYSVTITDAGGCETVGGTEFVDEPSPLQSNTDKDEAASEVSVTASGGTSPYQYEWSNGDQSATSVVDSTGTYTVTITDDNGCITTDSQFIQPTGYGELALTNNIKVYPNPNNGQFEVNFNGLNGAYDIVVRNIVGQTVAQDRVNVSGNAQKRFNLSDMNKGIYLIEVQDQEGKSATYKVVVK